MAAFCLKVGHCELFGEGTLSYWVHALTKFEGPGLIESDTCIRYDRYGGCIMIDDSYYPRAPDHTSVLGSMSVSNISELSIFK